MMKIKKSVFILLLLVVVSCKEKQTLQEYLVERQEKIGFVTVDIPTSFLQLKSEKVSEEMSNTLQSIRKINVVALPFKDNEEECEKEKVALENIFMNIEKYKNLMNIKIQGMHANLYYTGGTESIEEVIAFGYGEKKGVGVVRVLGDDMNPAKIVEMIQNVKIDKENTGLRELMTIFKGK